MRELIRIPVDSETHDKLKQIAQEQNKNLSDFLRDIIQRELGNRVNMRKGIKPRGGRWDRKPD